MQRISTLLQKLNELSSVSEDKLTVIDLDLMLDYTRVMYADLLELRKRIQFNESLTAPAPPKVTEPEMQPVPTSSAPSVELTSQVQSYALPDSSQPADEPHTGIMRDIRSAIGINDKYQFISELFSNDKEAYESVLDKVNSFDNYKSAIEWLDEHPHAQYGWNDEQFAVQSFYETLNRFFASR